MYQFRKIFLLFLLVISLTWSNQSLAQIDYENVILECKFKKSTQTHTKKQFKMHFNKYDLASISFKESHDRIVWSYRNLQGTYERLQS